MSAARLATFCIFAILASTQHLSAASIPNFYPIDPEDRSQIILVSQIKPGMKGYGKSVFRGTELETFQVEVLGVLEKMNMGTELVLVKLAGGPMTERQANLIEGMSGSPIFINGKLLGAFAYGGIFGKEPIGLVTPIQYMLEAWDPALPSQPSSFYPFSNKIGTPLSIGGRIFRNITIEAPGSPSTAPAVDTLVFRPLAVPVMVSGGSQKLVSRLQERLGAMNFHFMSGPGSSASPIASPSIEPGAAIGVALVTGDLDLSAIGTVTYVRGNKILAFGHPFFQIGALDADLTSAYVFDVFPSYLVSSKIAAPIKHVGRTIQDRPWCVSGELGTHAKKIPVTVHINDNSSGRKRDFKAQVINHPLLSTILLPIVASEGIYEVTGTPADSTAKVKFLVEPEDLDTITRENTFFSPTSIETAALTELEEIINLLHFNPFRPVPIKRVEVWVDIVPSHSTARLDKVFLRESKYEPGDTVEIGAILVPFKEKPIIKTINIALPKNIPTGMATLHVSSGMEAGAEVAVSGPSEEEGSDQPGTEIHIAPSIETVEQLIKKYLERDANNHLVAKLLLPRPVPSVQGEKLSGLPPSLASAMKSNRISSLSRERDEIKQTLPTDWVIFGSHRLAITIEEKSKSESVKSAPEAEETEEPEEEESEEEVPSEEDSGEELDDAVIIGCPGGHSLIGYASTSKPVSKVTFSAPSKPAESTESDEEKSIASESESSPTPTSAKPVGRTASTWRQTSQSEFSSGAKFNRTAVTTHHSVVLSPSLDPLVKLNDFYVWSVIGDSNHNVYAGTGNEGIIYKILPDGTTSVLYDSPEISVFCLAMDPDGNIYAGTSPNGILYKITPDGKATTLFDAPEKHIIALAFDSKQNLYAATGDACRVYKISNGVAHLVLDAPENHAVSLAIGPDDSVYVGTALNGIIYKIASDSSVTVIFDAREESVSALAIGPEDTLFAGTSPKGVIYKISPGKTPKCLYEKAGPGITSMAVDKSGNLYALNSRGVFKVSPDEKIFMLSNDNDFQFLSLAISGDNLYTGTGGMGGVCHASIGKVAEGTFESGVHDCGQRSQWGNISWTVNNPTGCSVLMQTRTGNSAVPDATWSPWSAPYPQSGAKILSPPARYIQYLATLRSENSYSPELKDLTILYLTQNQPPKVEITTPKGGEKWSKKRTIKWKASDPDEDLLVYEISYSTDGGATWKPLAKKVSTEDEDREKPSTETEPTETKPENADDPAANASTEPKPNRVLARIKAELDKHPGISEDVKSKLLPETTSEEATAPISEEQRISKPDTNTTKQTSFSWDTTKYPDGTYIIKVVASDAPSNPSDALKEEAISEAVIIANCPPEIVLLKKTAVVQSDKSAKVQGFARHSLVGITAVQYRVGSGDWVAAAPDDGVYDSTFEAFTVTTPALEKGTQTIEVKAFDQAGNSASAKIQVNVE